MLCKDFFRRVWPSSGNFCIMTNVTKKDGKPGRRHDVFDNMDDAYTHGRAEMKKTDVYFGLHTHINQSVFNNKYQRFGPSRKRENMASCKCLFTDMDVGKPEKDKPKYLTQPDAMVALQLFVFRTGLPWPIVVSSGNGLHCYWPYETAIDTAQWHVQALKFKLLLDHNKMIYDPSRLIDATSVLRMPTTFNHKDKEDLKLVKILDDGDVTPNAVLFDLLENLTAGMQPIKVPSAAGAPSSNGYVNIIPNTKGFPPTDPNDVAEECEQIRIVRDAQGVVPEHLWYPFLGVMTYCTDGEAIAHTWSSGDPRYTFAETQDKMDQWRANASVPSCAKFASDGMPGVCQKCKHFNGQYKNPIVITNKRSMPATAAFVQPQTASVQTIPGSLIPPPWPYMRIASFGIEKENAKGQYVPLIPGIDMYPVDLVGGYSHGVKINAGTSTWVVHEHRSGGKSDWSTIVQAPNLGLHDPKLMHDAFVTEGVMINFNAEVLKFMSAYLQALKAATGLSTQESHMGWPDRGDTSEFVMNGYKIDKTGAVTKCLMATTVDIMADAMTQRGTLNNQVQSLAFYSDPIYMPLQFAILASLGSPLMMATGQHGMVLHLEGDSGSGKSMATKAAASVWGNPVVYVANGTDNGMSVLARNKRAMAIPNHPQIIDEVTHAAAETMRAEVMAMTQNQLRITLNSNRQVREKPTGFRAMMAITNGNMSLHEIVNREDGRAGTANSARINEVHLDLTMTVHTKAQADDQLALILDNFGWIGPEFMKLAMPCMDQHFAMVRTLNKYIDQRTGVPNDMRFVTAGAAAQFAAGILARHFGFVQWDIEALMDWFCDVQMPSMMNRMRSQASTVSYDNVLRVFLAEQVNNTISIDATANIVPPTHLRDMVVVHHAVDLKEFWVHLGAFKTWCSKRGMNSQQLIDQIYIAGAIKEPNCQRILGKHTSWGRMRSTVFVVDATHKLIV